MKQFWLRRFQNKFCCNAKVLLLVCYLPSSYQNKKIALKVLSRFDSFDYANQHRSSRFKIPHQICFVFVFNKQKVAPVDVRQKKKKNWAYVLKKLRACNRKRKPSHNDLKIISLHFLFCITVLLYYHNMILQSKFLFILK